MKQLFKITAFLLLIFTSAGFTACSDDDDNGAGNAQSLIGTWCYAEEGYREEITFRSNGTGRWMWYDNEEDNGSEDFTYTYSDGVVRVTIWGETEYLPVEFVSQNKIRIDGVIHTRK